MTNKYEDFSQKAREQRKKQNMCLKKRPYNTEAKATKTGQDAYKCPICDKWHRTGAFNKFLNKVRRVSKKKGQ